MILSGGKIVGEVLKDLKGQEDLMAATLNMKQLLEAGVHFYGKPLAGRYIDQLSDH